MLPLLLVLASTACADHEVPGFAGPAPTSAIAPRRALDLLAETIAARRLVLLGEMHGTREIPALVGDLIERESRAGGPLVLALEITTRDQPVVDRYLASAGARADRAALLAGAQWTEPHHDGRDSQAMAGLIERVRLLRARGRDVSIVLFDPADAADRNRGMATILRATALAAPQARLRVLTGNVHAMTDRPAWDMFDESGRRIEPPMTAGRHLADLHPFSIDIEALGGTAWTCQAGRCGAHAYRAKPGMHAPAIDIATDVGTAWDATLLLPAFTASPPATLAK
ncbi:ChaN family lipoprotein [Cognatiluteimonas telluris]|uniref:ChaN family lipoprotein n=1 Tax=Cognatiluteimonas telluris TaxID=1104775 RepID=UPI00140D3AA4|nr:ChaN family lipoprotein [Lysobacter telluris]